MEVDVVTEFAIERSISELLYGDGLVLVCKTIKGVMDNFLKWMETFESK